MSRQLHCVCLEFGRELMRERETEESVLGQDLRVLRLNEITHGVTGIWKKILGLRKGGTNSG